MLAELLYIIGALALFIAAFFIAWCIAVAGIATKAHLAGQPVRPAIQPYLDQW